MDEFTKSFSSINWWLGVVLVGILLNVLSAYLKPVIDALFSNASSWWRNRSEKARSARAFLVAELRNDKHKQILMLADENRKRLRSIAILIFSLMFLLLYVSIKIGASSSIAAGTEPPLFWIRQFMYWGSMLLMFFSVLENRAAMKCKSLVIEAQESNEPEH